MNVVAPRTLVNELAVRRALLSNEHLRDEVDRVKTAAGIRSDAEWAQLLDRQQVAPCDCCDRWFERSYMVFMDYDKAAGNALRGWHGFLCVECAEGPDGES